MKALSVTLGYFIADSVEPSQLWGRGYALGNSDLDAYPLPNLGLGWTECEIQEGV